MYDDGRTSRRGTELGYARVRAAFDPEEEAHVRLAREAMRSRNGLLNNWEMNFLQSMIHIKWPSPKQLTTLEVLVAKARMPKPSKRARRRAGR